MSKELSAQEIFNIIKDNINVHTGNYGEYCGINEQSIINAAEEIVLQQNTRQPAGNTLKDQPRTFTIDEIIEAYMSGAKECYQFAGLPSEFPEYVMGNAKEYFKEKFNIDITRK